ncbi:MAG: cold shock domain-containing protein [Phyllobacterium sp.]|uniref:cold-shock protein n=1 Tax=Phyllobacterium sp. TaxID=1871046 RepID=UPI0030F0870D
MPVGTLKLWHTDRGFGWLTQDGSKRKPDLFIHFTEMKKAGLRAEEGAVYWYAISERDGKPIAVDPELT